jgi:DNA-binding Lrp family transcriptional regulator
VAENRNVYLDNEYYIMNEISDNKNISQRQLSKKLGLSLGTINVLINKMIKEGVIKMEQVSQKQVAYMLTPSGMVGKAKKTVEYLKVHYRAIYETREKIKLILGNVSLEYEKIIVLKSDDEMGNLIELAVNEYRTENKNVRIKVVDENYRFDSLRSQKNMVVLHGVENQELVENILKSSSLHIINILEKL